MRVHIQYDHPTDSVLVYALEDSIDGTRKTYFTFDNRGQLVGHTVGRHDTIEVLMQLHDRGEFLKALAKAASDIQPIEHATQEHLKDAITVRDRLLTIIENQEAKS